MPQVGRHAPGYRARAARLKLLTPAELLARLDDCLKLLTSGSRTALPRHKTLRAVVEWSHALLSKPEQALLRRLGVFAGSFSLPAATAVTAGTPIAGGEVFDLVAKLVEKSLVMPLQAAGVTRYRLLETTRAFALEHLDESGESHWWKYLCAYMADLFSEAERTFPNAPTAEWLDTFEPDLDNLRTALGWAFGPQGDPALGLRLLGRTLGSGASCRSFASNAAGSSWPWASSMARHRRQSRDVSISRWDGIPISVIAVACRRPAEQNGCCGKPTNHSCWPRRSDTSGGLRAGTATRERR